MNTGEILIYQNQEGSIKVDVRLEEETGWLTQDQMAQLFGKGRSTITEYIGNIFKDGELIEKVVSRKFRLVRLEGNPDDADLQSVLHNKPNQPTTKILK